MLAGGQTAEVLPVLATALAIAGSVFVAWRVHRERSLRLQSTAKAEMGPGHVGPRVVRQPLQVVIETPIADSPEVRGLYQNARAPLPAASEIRGLTPFFVNAEDDGGKSQSFDAGVGVANKEVQAAALRQRERIVEAFHKYGFIVVRQGFAQAQAEAAREELEGVIMADSPDVESIYFEGAIRHALQTRDTGDTTTTPVTALAQKLGIGVASGSDAAAGSAPPHAVGDDGAIGTTLSGGPDFHLGELPAEVRRAFVRKVMGYSHAGHPRLQLLASTCQTVAEALCASPMKLMQDMAMVKPPGGREKPWHQDSAFFKYHPVSQPIVGVWVALSRVTRENGCMCVLLPPTDADADGKQDLARGSDTTTTTTSNSNSRRRTPCNDGLEEEVEVEEEECAADVSNLPPHLRVFPHFKRRDWQICDDDIRQRQHRTAAIPMQPGDVLFFSSLLPHGTQVNVSDTQRWAVQLHFVGQDARPCSDELRLKVFGTEGKDVTC